MFVSALSRLPQLRRHPGLADERGLAGTHRNMARRILAQMS
jgi:hypothetical protein